MFTVQEINLAKRLHVRVTTGICCNGKYFYYPRYKIQSSELLLSFSFTFCYTCLRHKYVFLVQKRSLKYLLYIIHYILNRIANSKIYPLHNSTLECETIT